MIHKSDCEVYNEPAYPKGYCSCGADKVSNAKWFLEGYIQDALDDLHHCLISDQGFTECVINFTFNLKGDDWRLSII